MARVWAIATNTLVEIRNRRIVWVAVLVGSVVALMSITPAVFMAQAREAGETKMVERIGAQLMEQTVGGWAFAAWLLAAVLGATAFSIEVRAKTIVTVLARPIERWEYLVGRWLGVQLFAICFLLAGVAMALALGAYVGVAIRDAFWLAAVEHAVGIFFMGGVSLALGTVLPPAIAGTTAMLLDGFGGFARRLAHAPYLAARLAAWGLYVLAPASTPSGLVGSASQDVLAPRYGLFAAVLAENLLYACTAVVLACWWLGRREIRLGT